MKNLMKPKIKTKEKPRIILHITNTKKKKRNRNKTTNLMEKIPAWGSCCSPLIY